ncbi:unnamed protein product [Blepharisma stoltei]|uniref:Uncharacterized protein n=1 Tax=Blepharisma stoltei TaxID=1481888 RepID=A0AAU9K7C6_9CILI|nr:unnamed protein product [Blepharisma stoltei]
MSSKFNEKDIDGTNEENLKEIEIKPQNKRPKLFGEDGKISSDVRRDLKKTEHYRTSQGFTPFDPDIVKEQLQQVTWGFGEDAENEVISKEDMIFYEEVLDLNKLKNRKGLTDKQRKTIRQLEAANEKVGNFAKELENLHKKTQEGLTQGQTRRMEQLAERLEEMQGERDMIEEKLRSSFFDSYQPFKKKVKGEYDYSSDEDEFYDRAKNNPKIVQESSTEELQEKLGKLLNERLQVRIEIEKSNQEEEFDAEDTLDAYMNENSVVLKRENLDRLAMKLRDLNSKIDEIYAVKPGLCPKQKEEIKIIEEVSKEEDKEIRDGLKKRRVYGAEEKPVPRNEEIKANDLDFYDENESWMPPEGQTGDGRTNLNEKYGY